MVLHYLDVLSDLDPKAETLVACSCVINRSCNGKGKNGSCLRLKAFAACLWKKKRDDIDKRHRDSNAKEAVSRRKLKTFSYATDSGCER